MLVGRAAERAVLDGLVEDARAGRGGSVLLRGDPGIGKTALLDTLDEAAGVTVLGTRGFEADAALPFAALITLLGPVAGHRDLVPPGPRAALEAALALGPPASADRFAAYHGMLLLLEAAADETGPLVLRVDDAHWLDPASMEALAYCARRVEDLPVGIAVATRIAEGVEATLPGAHVLTLAPLDDAAARAVIELTGDRVADDVATRLVRVAGGNPLALVEIPGSLTDEERSGLVPLPDPLPVTAAIDGALRRHMERLSTAAQEALVVVAAGIHDDPGQIRAACRELGSSDDAIDEAVKAGVLAVRDAGIGFAHPLMRSVVLKTAAAPAVRSAHRVLAGLALPDRAGWHLAAAAVGQDDEAAAALDVAGASAAARTAFATASDAFARAAELSSVPDARAGRLLHAAGTGQMAGRFPQAIAHLEEAATLVTDPALGAEIDHVRGMVRTYAGATAEGVRLLFGSARRVATFAPARAAQMLVDSSMAWGMAGEPGMSLVACQEARRIGHLDDLGRAKLELAEAYGLIFGGRGRQAKHRLPQIAGAYETLEVGRDDHALICGAIVQQFLGRPTVARRMVKRCIEVCRELGALGPLPFYLALAADIAFMTEEWADGYAEGAESATLAMETGQGPIAAYSLCVHARLAAAMGRRDVSEALLARAEPLIATAGTVALEVWYLHARAFLEIGEGRTEAALPHFGRLASIWVDREVKCAESLPWEQDHFEALVALGRVSEARQRLRWLAEESHRSDGAHTLAIVSRCRGLLDPAFDEHFRRVPSTAFAGADPL
ncbi:MAG: ATP-binding protein [Thermoleophilia bacterium]